MANIQRRIQRLEEQTPKGGTENSEGLSRAMAELCFRVIHKDEDFSPEEREAKIQEYMEPKARPKSGPNPGLSKKARKMLDKIISRNRA